MRGARILAVDDDRTILRVVKRALEASGYDVEAVESGRRARESAAAFRPDVILLDLVLPDADGIELTRELAHGNASVIVLSALGDDRKKVEALDAGADDYLTKPFSVDELEARIRVALRHRAGSRKDPAIDVGALHLDLAAREVTVAGNPVRLTPREFELLRELAVNAGKVLTQGMLLSRVWGPEFRDESHILRTFIYQLRLKLDEAKPGTGSMVVTDPRVGYRLETPKP